MSFSFVNIIQKYKVSFSNSGNSLLKPAAHTEIVPMKMFSNAFFPQITIRDQTKSNIANFTYSYRKYHIRAKGTFISTRLGHFRFKKKLSITTTTSTSIHSYDKYYNYNIFH